MLSKEKLKQMHGKAYVASFEKEQSQFRLARLIHSLPVSKNHKVADFGCGSGMLVPLLADRVDSYTGIDFSKQFIEAAKCKNQHSGSNINFICADILTFCSSNQAVFDLAFAMDFSEHVYDKEWLDILKAINSSLKEGGKLYIHTPNADFFLEMMKKHNFIVKQFPEHIAVRDLQSNCDLLKSAGFSIGKSKLIAHYNVLRALHPISFVPVIGRYFKARIFIEAVKDNVSLQSR